jgi:hypothetical protein
MIPACPSRLWQCSSFKRNAAYARAVTLRRAHAALRPKHTNAADGGTRLALRGGALVAGADRRSSGRLAAGACSSPRCYLPQSPPSLSCFYPPHHRAIILLIPLCIFSSSPQACCHPSHHLAIGNACAHLSSDCAQHRGRRERERGRGTETEGQRQRERERETKRDR